ncbi:sensor histidine kinase [[Clostridium] polysaccharolyticum]|uniref:GHKL domain-containing protein n=1 Tax=[Clostridium] polysaccharolyticum TaxID=29364 RepID=A0A1I0CCB1_9FIRM|nr:GHKL domain-containing protein [[Clostridium] polysaccharolyticum]SET16640.1 GHKL domain-containing protein [[Clostridium] polysaccharolyticum]
MAGILKMALLGWIEPLLWYKSMSARYVQNSRKKCILALWVYYTLIMLKQFITDIAGNTFLQGIAMAAIEFYVILATVFFFKGRLRNKFISVFVYYCILLAAELLVVKSSVVLLHTDVDTLFQNQMAYNICGLLITLVKAIACYCFFGSLRVREFLYYNLERIGWSGMIGAMLFYLLARRSQHEKQFNIFIFEDTVQILFLFNVFSVGIALKKKDGDILDLQQDISQSRERSALVQDIDRFKHSYAINKLVMQNLLQNQQYNELGNYMEETFKEVEKAALLFSHSNLSIRILISRFIKTARKMGISFSARIQIEEFGMEEEDICTILQNLISNGLEAAAKVPQDIAYVSLQILSNGDEYEIRCSNNCMGTVDFTKTSKPDQQMHGFGGGIIDRTVKKYYGIIKRQYRKTEQEGIGRVTISIRVPFGEGLEKSYISRKKVNL